MKLLYRHFVKVNKKMHITYMRSSTSKYLKIPFLDKYNCLLFFYLEKYKYAIKTEQTKININFHMKINEKINQEFNI